MRAFDAQLHRPQRPRRGGRAVLGRLGQELELRDASGSLAVGRAEAIGAGIAAADDDDVLAGGKDLVGDAIAFADLVLLRQELHREVDAFQLAAGDVEIARLLGAAGQQDGVELAAQVVDRHVAADVGVGDELHAFGAHLLDAAVDQVLLHLEIRDAVAQQAADAVALLEYGDGVSGARELLRGGQTGGARSDDGDALAGA